MSTQPERESEVESAIHSTEMEGLSITPEALSDAQRYIDGQLTATELRTLVRARYGVVVSIHQ